MRKLLLRWLLPRGFEFKVTTHEGFYSPCDDDHCFEVRRKLRAMLS